MSTYLDDWTYDPRDEAPARGGEDMRGGEAPQGMDVGGHAGGHAGDHAPTPQAPVTSAEGASGSIADAVQLAKELSAVRYPGLRFDELSEDERIAMIGVATRHLDTHGIPKAGEHPTAGGQPDSASPRQPTTKGPATDTAQGSPASAKAAQLRFTELPPEDQRRLLEELARRTGSGSGTRDVPPPSQPAPGAGAQ